MTQIQLIAIVLFLCLAWISPAMAEEITFEDDGWYSWEVPAGHGGQKSCCYSFNNGNIVRRGCRLDHGMDEFSITEPCDEYSTSMQIFVEVRKGQIRNIQPLSSACPVKSDSEVVRIENVTETQSVAWLKDQVAQNQQVADDAVMALSFHTKDYALQSLVDLLEDRGQKQDTREQALFWLVQSDYDEAYAYLDRLLK
ncbi:MAG TPA: hypothetical protein VJ984_01750 [Xanthomonadales bacterium]|nr:hypothetical protein [Xanthomonadales bacterium]